MDSKWIGLSKTIIGLVITALALVLPEFGISFSDEDGTLISGTVDKFVELGGLLFAAYGRWVATDSLTVKP